MAFRRERGGVSTGWTLVVAAGAALAVALGRRAYAGLRSRGEGRRRRWLLEQADYWREQRLHEQAQAAVEEAERITKEVRGG